jgi:hypothetical protein
LEELEVIGGKGNFTRVGKLAASLLIESIAAAD